MTAPIVRELKAAGYAVDLGNGDAYPRWCHDMGAVRRLLLEHNLRPVPPIASPWRTNTAEVNA